MTKMKIEKDIESTIRLLRFISNGQGYVEIDIFDAGAGGGFSKGHILIHLERDGLNFTATAFSIEDFKNHIMDSLKAHESNMEKINEYYKNSCWNR